MKVKLSCRACSLFVHHLRDKKGQGRGTKVILATPHGDYEGVVKLHRPVDKFNKFSGRKLALIKLCNILREVEITNKKDRALLFQIVCPTLKNQLSRKNKLEDGSFYG